jgi:hypothetical protein
LSRTRWNRPVAVELSVAVMPRAFLAATAARSVADVTPSDDPVPNASGNDGVDLDASVDHADTTGRGGWRVARRLALTIVFVGFAAFWIWALFFASKTAVNKIDDRAWAERAEAICDDVDAELAMLERQTSTDLAVRADLVVLSTDLLSGMVDQLEAVEPTDEKGRAIVPDWIADYRTLLDDRYAYADRLRSGEDIAFTETAVEGVPITERIETFAGDNEMPSCAPPRGSVL